MPRRCLPSHPRVTLVPPVSSCLPQPMAMAEHLHLPGGSSIASSLLPAPPRMPLAVLGFGDRQFPAFCGYAHEVVRAAEAQGSVQLLPMDVVDRQSPQDFARWGRSFRLTLWIELTLNHQPTTHKSQMFTLISRRNYGAECRRRPPFCALHCLGRRCGSG